MTLTDVSVLIELSKLSYRCPFQFFRSVITSLFCFPPRILFGSAHHPLPSTVRSMLSATASADRMLSHTIHWVRRWITDRWADCPPPSISNENPLKYTKYCIVRYACAPQSNMGTEPSSDHAMFLPIHCGEAAPPRILLQWDLLPQGWQYDRREEPNGCHNLSENLRDREDQEEGWNFSRNK